jgi:hypothetical protein
MITAAPEMYRFFVPWNLLFSPSEGGEMSVFNRQGKNIGGVSNAERI